jgi:hypothetical protein
LLKKIKNCDSRPTISMNVVTGQPSRLALQSFYLS